MTNLLEYDNWKNKFIFNDGVDISLITHNNFNILVYVNDYSWFDEGFLENFIEFCISKCVWWNSIFYFLWKNSKKVDRIWDYMIVNSYLKHNENKNYLIPLICDSKKKLYDWHIYNFITHSLSNNIKYSYIITNEKKIEKKVYEIIKDHLNREIYLKSQGL